MNRAQRRRAKATASKTAQVLADRCHDYGSEGNLVKVTHPRALALLQRAFAYMLANGCQPHVIQISQPDARTFPRGRNVVVSDDCPSWLGVGLDVEGRGTYSLRHVKVPGAPKALEKMICIEETKAALKQQTAKAGFPVTTTRGRC